MAGVEFFQSKKKWGWWLRTTAIEFTRAAVFPSQAAARVNALADVRAAMKSLGIPEASDLFVDIGKK